MLLSAITFLDYSIRLIRFLILFGLEVEPVWYKNKIPSNTGWNFRIEGFDNGVCVHLT